MHTPSPLQKERENKFKSLESIKEILQANIWNGQWWEGLPKLWTDLELLLPWSSLMLMDLATKNSKARLQRILTPWTGQKQQVFELWPASKGNSITHVPFTSKPLPASSQHTWLRSSVNACPAGFPQHCTWRLVDLPILGPLQFTYVYNFCRTSMIFIWIHLDRMLYMSLRYQHSLEAQHHANDSEQLRRRCTTRNKSRETVALQSQMVQITNLRRTIFGSAILPKWYSKNANLL